MDGQPENIMPAPTLSDGENVRKSIAQKCQVNSANNKQSEQYDSEY